MEKEIWKSVINGRYLVSNFGRVKGMIKKKGTQVGRALQGCQSDRGYIKVHSNELNKDFYIHRLVMEAFVGPCPKGKEVNHKDGNKANNRLDNLEYLTRKENSKHAYKTGLREPIRGEENVQAKLTEEIVLQMRACYRKGVTLASLGRKFGVSYVTVGKIVRYEKWKHVK